MREFSITWLVFFGVLYYFGLYDYMMFGICFLLGLIFFYKKDVIEYDNSVTITSTDRDVVYCIYRDTMYAWNTKTSLLSFRCSEGDWLTCYDAKIATRIHKAVTHLKGDQND